MSPQTAPTMPTRKSPSARKAAIADLERAIADQAPALEKTAPEQLRDMRGVLAALKAARGAELPETAKATLRRLFVWQLERQRAHYQAQLQRLATKDPAAAKTKLALDAVVAALDEAKRAVTTGGAGAQARVEKAADRARTALVAAKAPAASAPRAAKPSAPPRTKSDTRYAVPTWLAGKLAGPK